MIGVACIMAIFKCSLKSLRGERQVCVWPYPPPYVIEIKFYNTVKEESVMYRLVGEKNMNTKLLCIYQSERPSLLCVSKLYTHK